MSSAVASLSSEIVSEPRILSGEPVIAGTATTVRAIAEMWTLGMAPEEIPIHLPHLQLSQVFAALHYYLTHREQIDAYIAANRYPEEWSGKQYDPATGKVIDPATGKAVN
jgi:uncharacterized protein (DUF433 family)